MGEQRVNSRTRRIRRGVLAGASVCAVLLVGAAVAWACVPVGTISVNPTEGEAGSQTTVTGTGFSENQRYEIRWDDPARTLLSTGNADQNGRFSRVVTIPADACRGDHVITAQTGPMDHSMTRAAYRVTTMSAPACPPPSSDPNQPPPSTGNNNQSPPTGTTRPVSRRSRAIAACKRRYRGSSRAAKRKRAACIRRAKRRYRA